MRISRCAAFRLHPAVHVIYPFRKMAFRHCSSVMWRSAQQTAISGSTALLAQCSQSEAVQPQRRRQTPLGALSILSPASRQNAADQSPPLSALTTKAIALTQSTAMRSITASTIILAALLAQVRAFAIQLASSKKATRSRRRSGKTLIAAISLCTSSVSMIASRPIFPCRQSCRMTDQLAP